MTPILLDSSAIVALLDRRDHAHSACMQVMREIRQPLFTCEAVISESWFLLRAIRGAGEDVVANVARGNFELRFELKKSVIAVLALMHKYRDVPMSLADACLVQMADELDTGDILTLDSDFQHYRWRKNKRFNLLIPLGRER